MKYLVQGMESRKKIELLISATKIKREKLVSALIDHFAGDMSVACSAAINGVKQPNLSLAIMTINEVAEKFEKYHEMKIHNTQ